MSNDEVMDANGARPPTFARRASGWRSRWLPRRCCASGRWRRRAVTALGVDEPEVMERAVRMMKTGDFNPHFFDYPSLYMYVQAVVACRALPVRARCAANGRRWPA